jgi:CRP-like cAMP-binding protein
VTEAVSASSEEISMTVEPDFWEVSWQFEGEAFEAVRSMGEELTYKAQSTIFKEGDEGDAMYLVLEGYALVVGIDRRTGDEQTLSIIAAGQSFGELALLVQQPRLATVLAGTDLRVLKVTPATLEALEEKEARGAAILYKKLARTLAEELIIRGELPSGRKK